MSCSYFLLCGYPRSRTAWLSNLFTHGNTWCAHEATGDVRSIADLPRFLAASGRWHVGNADSGQIMWLARIRSLLPGARIAVIDREEADVIQSLAGVGIHTGVQILQMLRPRLEILKNEPGVLTIPFHELDRAKAVERLWKHCCPDEPWDEARYRYMRDMNIQLTGAALRRRTAQVMQNLETLRGEIDPIV